MLNKLYLKGRSYLDRPFHFLKRHLRGPAGILLGAAVVVGMALKVSSWSRLKDTAHMVCGLTQLKYFDPGKVDEAWMRDCLSVADGFPVWQNQKSFLDRLQMKLDLLETSHLQIYTPAEDLSMWTGAAVDTGLRVRMFESGAVVYKVLSESPAADAHVQVGDLLLLINGNPVFSVQQAQAAKGEYVFRRGGRGEGQPLVRIAMRPRIVVEDQRPLLVGLPAGAAHTAGAASGVGVASTAETAHGAGGAPGVGVASTAGAAPAAGTVGLLRIPSFRAELFPAHAWKKMVADMAKYRRLIVDLRDNSGGNFVTMLRVLSPFFCKATSVGEVSSVRRQGEQPVEFADDVRDEYQLSVLDGRGRVNLKTFSDYGCFTAPVTVLLDSGTASVSEIFAVALKNQRNALLLGGATAGDVVVGVWYALPLLGAGYSLSIPEAVYFDSNGEVLEGKGVWPHRTLYYKEEDALRGYDTWIEHARR